MRVVGCSVGTGWAVLVTLDESPAVVDRLRIQLLSGDGRFVYHAASQLSLGDAEVLLADALDAATKNATSGIAEIAADSAAIVTAASWQELPLEDILASHPAIHAAEGRLYRRALGAALQARGIPTRWIPRATLTGAVIDLGALGRAAGPPWRKEHKEAAAAAWLAICSQ